MSDEMYRADIVFDVNDAETLRRLEHIEQRIDRMFRRLKQGGRMAVDTRTTASEVARTSKRVTDSMDKIDKRGIKLSRRKFTPVIDAKDEASKKADRVEKTMQRISRTRYITSVRLGGDSEVLRRITDINRKLDDMGRKRVRPRVTVQGNGEKKLSLISTMAKKLGGMTATITVKAADMTGGLLSGLTRGAAGTLAVGGAAAAGGGLYALNLAGQKENSLLGMSFFTGSPEKGREAYAELENFAAVTPYEMPFVREQAVGLMGMYKGMQGKNFDEKQMREDTLRSLTAFGNAAGLTGAGENGATLSLLGFRQIGTIGKLQLEELRQVTENLLVPMSMIAEEFELSGLAKKEEIGSIGDKDIPADKAMAAIVRALEKNFEGGMEQLSKTQFGMWSTLKDTARIATTELGVGISNPIKEVMADLIKETDYTQKEFKDFAGGLRDIGGGIGEFFRDSYFETKGYLSDIFNDPEYKKLTTSKARLGFVYDTAMEDLDKWWESSGKEGAGELARRVTDTIALGLSNSQPMIEAALKLGVELGKGIAQGIMSDPTLATIFGGLLIGKGIKGLDLGGGGKGGGGGGGPVVVPPGTPEGGGKGGKPGKPATPKGFGILNMIGMIGMADYAADFGNQAGDWIFGHQPGQPKGKTLFENPFLKPETYEDYRPGVVKRIQDQFFPVNESTATGRGVDLTGLNTMQRAAMGEDVKPASKDDMFNVMTGLNLPKTGDPQPIDNGQLSTLIGTIENAGLRVQQSIQQIQIAPPAPAINFGSSGTGTKSASPTPTFYNPLNPLSNLFPKYANGGILNRPHIGVVAEGGYPESIIPHDPSKRSRALGLLYETADRLGVGMYADGAIVGGEYTAPSAFGSSAGSGPSIGTLIGSVNIDKGGDVQAQIAEILDMVASELYAVMTNTE